MFLQSALMWIVVCLLLLAHLLDVAVTNSKGCPKLRPDCINVHVIAHSHLDVGWRKTVDQYYYGLNDTIQHAGVQYIYDTVLHQLNLDPKKRFIFVEMAFFSKWWRDQNKEVKRNVRKLVKKGRLSFNGGGWVMNDEACTMYSSTIDQMTLGLEFLKSELDFYPSVSWQIDPFGHTSSQSGLFNRMGFKSQIINRIHYKQADRMHKEKAHEFIWQLAGGTLAFISHMYDHYNPPHGFCFDEFCAEDPIVSDPVSKQFNAHARAKAMYNYITEQTKSYRTTNLLLPMGSDFHFQNAHHSFKSIDQLIKAVNDQYSNKDSTSRCVNMVYSNPNCYMSAVTESIINAPSFDGHDFVPYCSEEFACWTGYFTSRPSIKKLDRFAANVLKAFKQINANLLNGAPGKEKYRILAEWHAILQHHDAITGTSKQHVVNDYISNVHDAMQTTVEAFSNQVFEADQDEKVPFELCLLPNISQCPMDDLHDQFSIAFYNPSSHTTNSLACRFPAYSDRVYNITDRRGISVNYQLIDLDEGVLFHPDRRSNTDIEIAMECDVPSQQASIFHVTSTSTGFNQRKRKNIKKRRLFLENEYLEFATSLSSNLLFRDKVQDINAEVRIDVGYYEGHSYFLNDSKREMHTDGAYVFSPVRFTSLHLQNTSASTGRFVNTATMIFSDTQKQITVNLTLRLIRDLQNIEVAGMVGSLDKEGDMHSRNMVVRYTIDKPGLNEGYISDSNCMETRVRSYCNPNSLDEGHLSECYMPVCGYMSLQSDDQRLNIMVDRTQGGTAFKNATHSTAEFMVHRRSIQDDNLGMDETLDETGTNERGLWIKFQHWISLSNKSERYLKAEWSRLAGNEFLKMYMNYNQNIRFVPQPSIPASLSANINVLTWERLNEHDYLLRLENMNDYGTDQNTIVDMQDLVKSKIASVKEMTLAANMVVQDYGHSGGSCFTTKVQMEPLQIRTFVITANQHLSHY